MLQCICYRTLVSVCSIHGSSFGVFNKTPRSPAGKPQNLRRIASTQAVPFHWRFLRLTCVLLSVSSCVLLLVKSNLRLETAFNKRKVGQTRFSSLAVLFPFCEHIASICSLICLIYHIEDLIFRTKTSQPLQRVLEFLLLPFGILSFRLNLK